MVKFLEINRIIIASYKNMARGIASLKYYIFSLETEAWLTNTRDLLRSPEAALVLRFEETTKNGIYGHLRYASPQKGKIVRTRRPQTGANFTGYENSQKRPSPLKKPKK